MRRTRIKFCGITRPEDAIAAAEAGADAIGLVFYPRSPRALAVEQAAEIVRRMPPLVTPAGLFVDAATDALLQTAVHVGLRHIQLHGRETPGRVRELINFRVIKSVRVDRSSLASELERWHGAARSLALPNLSLLLETSALSADGVPGGSGIQNDWDAIADALAAGQPDGFPPLILAGGLTPENVGDVVRRFRPYAVDVSSGIESAKGIKSAEKMNAFAAAVRAADADGC